MKSATSSYGRQWIDEDDIAAVVGVLTGDHLTQGPAVDSFEKSLADYVGAKYCVSFSNATAALHCAVAALDIRPGSEGITSTNTFVASANCLAYNKIKPVLADINAVTYNIDPKTIEARQSDLTRLLIPVHFAGQACDMMEIQELARRHDYFVIEDASHAIGSRYHDGGLVGNCQYSDMTVFSFHPVKTLTTGEGGAVTTNCEKLYKALKLFRSHGITRDVDVLSANPGPWYYEQVELGFNYRLTDIQAALGHSQLKKLDFFKSQRRKIVTLYNEKLADVHGVTTPKEAAGLDSCFHLYVIQIDFASLGLNRATVMQQLQREGIGTQVHYIPVHTQPWYQANYGYKVGDCAIAESYYEQALSLPLHPHLGDVDVIRVVEALKRVVAK